ncbi:hypothetical protein NKG94_09145 [Micromonospora sp. M12]
MLDTEPSAGLNASSSIATAALALSIRYPPPKVFLPGGHTAVMPTLLAALFADVVVTSCRPATAPAGRRPRTRPPTRARSWRSPPPRAR